MITVPAYFVQMYAHQLHEKHDLIPGISERINKAADILSGDNISIDNSQFFVVGSKNDGTGYHITATDCSCPDFQNNQAPIISRQRFCKHRLAVGMLKRHIAEQISPRILDGLDDAPNRNTIKWQKNGTKTEVIWLIRHGSAGDCLTDGHRFGIRIIWSSKLELWTPRTDPDYIQAASWLETVARPIPYGLRKDWETAPDAKGPPLPFAQWQELYSHMYKDLHTSAARPEPT